MPTLDVKLLFKSDHRNKTSMRISVSLFLLLAFACAGSIAHSQVRWSAEKANAWHAKAGWWVGCNYSPAYAINQLEMWQSDTFDLKAIDRELGWGQSIGLNTVRVFLHNLLWEQDSAGFLKRMDQFLNVAKKHKIGVMFVLFDSCWDPYPAPGKQRAPKPGVHNSGWVQSPGRVILEDPAKVDALKPYVDGVLNRFKNDSRVVMWDLMNEPDNDNREAYGKVEPKNKADLGFALLKKVFAWAQAIRPTQPLTSGIWLGDWTSHERMKPMDSFLVENSDIITYHNYDALPEMKARVGFLKRYGRPLICTEYMARPMGSTFEAILPFLKSEGVGALNWGFVQGKTQTNYPWDSWKKAYTQEPPVWFHEIFRNDGKPYREEEVKLFREMTGKG